MYFAPINTITTLQTWGHLSSLETYLITALKGSVNNHILHYWNRPYGQWIKSIYPHFESEKICIRIQKGNGKLDKRKELS